jgi:hypothetical protein
MDTTISKLDSFSLDRYEFKSKRPQLEAQERHKNKILEQLKVVL